MTRNGRGGRILAPGGLMAIGNNPLLWPPSKLAVAGKGPSNRPSRGGGSAAPSYAGKNLAVAREAAALGIHRKTLVDRLERGGARHRAR